jgi:hypothetical protein
MTVFEIDEIVFQVGFFFLPEFPVCSRIYSVRRVLIQMKFLDKKTKKVDVVKRNLLKY